MSNGVDSPQGLQPFSHYNGATWNQQTQTYRILSAYDTGIFQGSAVSLLADGTIMKYDPADQANTPMLGVFWGCEYYDAKNEYQYSNQWVANTAIGTRGIFGDDIRYAKAFIITDLSVVYTIQIAGPNAVLVEDIGQNTNLSVDAGNTQTGISTASITGFAVTATLPLKIVDVSPYILTVTNVGGIADNNNALVMVNSSCFRAGTLGV